MQCSGTGRVRNYQPRDESDNIESKSQQVQVFDFKVNECSRAQVTFSLPREKTEKLSERLRPLVHAVFEFDSNTKEGNYVNFHVSRARVPDMLTNQELYELECLGAIPAPVTRKVALVGHPFSAIEVADYRCVAQVVDWLYCQKYLSYQDAQNCMQQTDILCEKAIHAEQIQLKIKYKEVLMPHITSIINEAGMPHVAIFWLEKMIDTLTAKGLSPELGYDMVLGKAVVFEDFETCVGAEVASKESVFILGCYFIDPILFEEAHPQFTGCNWESFRNVLWSSLQNYKLPPKKQQERAAHQVVHNTITCDMATFKVSNMVHVRQSALWAKQEQVLEEIKASAYFFEGTHRQIVAKLKRSQGSCLLGPIEGDSESLLLYFYTMNLGLEYLRLQVEPQGTIMCGPLKIDDLNAFLLRKQFLLVENKLVKLEKSEAEIAKEFELISKEVISEEYYKSSLDMRVNRGGNTALPYDSNRVKLLGGGYINASLVKLAEGTSYICAQGPYIDAKCNSAIEFWQMIWQHNTPVMLMLTDLASNDKTYCSKYWPDVDAKSEEYGKITVKCMREQLRYCGGSQDHDEALSFRVFKLSRVGHKSRFVYQFKYENWQEGQGANPSLVKRLIHDTNSLRKACGIARPLLVHSSLGTGRTGAFVALHHLLERIELYPKQIPEVLEVVKSLRNTKNGRPGMVQTLAQYQFLYNVLNSGDSVNL